MKLYNTLTRSVDEFAPLSPPEVRIYCCGPTVYNYQHIGNLRTYIFEDLLVRTLRYGGYDVKHVMNITDVGHLVSDADQGEDKMLVAARREGKRSEEIAEFYTKIFFEHCSWLNITPPNVVCKATDHIKEMIALIERLEARGFAYCAEGNVYFDVSKLSDYGKLARLDLESLQSGARISVDKAKRNPLDFALWFTKSKFENQELQWDSPWGRGYPGWHIECSAMSMKYLGPEFDIHCGGIDHIPVHHTNEIAQCEGATSKNPARWWMHGGFLVTSAAGESDAQKMSKSTGEFLTLDRLTERGFDPMSYRLLCLSGSYRNELSWSWQALEGAANSLKRMKQSVTELRDNAEEESSSEISSRENELRAAFRDAIFDDLSMPRALAVLHSVLGEASLGPQRRLALLEEFDRVLGLGMAAWRQESQAAPDAVVALADARKQARAARNWTEADRLRNEIARLGYTVEDTKDGYTLKHR